MAINLRHENLEGIFRLWLNWVMVAGAISLLVVLSLWMPPAAVPVVAIMIQMGFFMLVKANRRKKLPSCYILPFLAARIFFWTAVVMVVVLMLYSRHLIETIFEGDTINTEIPFITVLVIGPVTVAVTLFAVVRGGKLRFCRDCKIRNGFPAERGFLGNLFSQEGKYQTRMLLNVSALVTLVGWVYYFLAYVNVNLNEPDRLVFFWTPLAVFVITIVMMAVRYMGLCNYYEEHFEGSGQQMRRSTLIRFIIIADNTIVVRPPQADPDMNINFADTCYDTPASLIIPHRQKIGLDEAHSIFRDLMGINAEIRPMYVTDNGNADCNIFHFICFLSEKEASSLALARPELIFASIYQMGRLIDTRQTAKLLSAEVYRLHTMAMAWKTYDSQGQRRYRIKHYQPTFRLRDVHKWQIDYNDNNWLSVNEFNADKPFYRLRRFWKKHITGNA